MFLARRPQQFWFEGYENSEDGKHCRLDEHSRRSVAALEPKPELLAQ
jgi:hypothetical protein